MSGHRFALENEIAAASRMDSTVNISSGSNRGNNNNGGSVVWSNKENHNGRGGGANKSSAGGSKNNSSLNGSRRFGTISLGKRPASSSFEVCRTAKTAKSSPGRALTPSRVAGLPVTPSRKATPGGGGADDRFIPNRSATDFEGGAYRLLGGAGEAEGAASPSKREHRRQMAEALLGAEPDAQTRIMAYSAKPPNAPEHHLNGNKVLYSSGAKAASASKKPNVRHIPQMPERILDAPELVNDYYLNLLDWSADNRLAVALGENVYLWNADNGEIHQLMALQDADDYVCSVKFTRDGNCIAVGTPQGDVELWDVGEMKKLRTMSGHTDRVGCLSWNQHVLSSGSRSGKINHSDVRVAQHLVASVDAHSQEVCGMSWSPDGRMLASGGNDNVLNVWEAAGGQCFFPAGTPKFSFTEHQAAVKAVAWCPWQSGVLASGGGTADRCIRIWNCNNGNLLNTVDTKSQVCALLWSTEYRELISSHGFARNEVTIWKYPTMTKVAELLGHTERVLYMAMSPDGSVVVSGGADETLRLWKCFAPDPSKKDAGKSAKSSCLLTRAGIR